MSIAFALSKRVAMDELFDGRLKSFGITEHVAADTTENWRCLRDDSSHLWIVGGKDKSGQLVVSRITVWASCGHAVRILDAIAEAFDTEIYSEHEPQYFGYETEEDLETAEWAMTKQRCDEFYDELVSYLDNEPSGIKLGTFEEDKAKLAKKLIYKNPELATPSQKETLLGWIGAEYPHRVGRGARTPAGMSHMD